MCPTGPTSNMFLGMKCIKHPFCFCLQAPKVVLEFVCFMISHQLLLWFRMRVSLQEHCSSSPPPPPIYQYCNCTETLFTGKMGSKLNHVPEALFKLPFPPECPQKLCLLANSFKTILNVTSSFNLFPDSLNWD